MIPLQIKMGAPSLRSGARVITLASSSGSRRVSKDAVSTSMKQRAKAYWDSLDNMERATTGATLGFIGGTMATAPIQMGLYSILKSQTEVAKNKIPRRLKKEDGEGLYQAIKQFKKDHPDVKKVPIYISGKVPSSMYVPEASYKIFKKQLKEEFGVKGPGVYLKETAAPVALHELGHAVIDKKAPPVKYLQAGAALANLPLLAYAIMKNPRKAGWLYRNAPWVSAGLSAPLLAEEAAASLMAAKSLPKKKEEPKGKGRKKKKKKEGGAGMLIPAWMTYGVGATVTPLAIALAKKVKRI